MGGSQKWSQVLVLCLVLLLIDILVLLLPLLHVYIGQRSSSHAASFLLPFREKYFKVLSIDNNDRRSGDAFERGINDAAFLFRVNVSIERTNTVTEAIEHLEEAQDALYDGLILSSFDVEGHVSAIHTAHERTPVMLPGALESFEAVRSEGMGHIGERAADVGRLAGAAMKAIGVKTLLCLSHEGDLESMYRCRGFKDAFEKQTYDLDLKTTLQSELKSKLIPIILDDSEINGLFVSDVRSFGLAHQILKSLNRLCTNKSIVHRSRCIYLGAYGTDAEIIKALTKGEVQFTIDPQNYLRGYLAMALTTLGSLGYRLPSSPPSSMSLLLSSVVHSEDVDRWLLSGSCRMRDRSTIGIRLTVVLWGSEHDHVVRELKNGLKMAARDLNVHVQFRHESDVGRLSSEAALYFDQSGDVDGVAIGIGSLSESHPSGFQPTIRADVPVISYGRFDANWMTTFPLHVGYVLHTEADAEVMDQRVSGNPALQGYLSVLLLSLNVVCGYMPSGQFHTVS